MEFGDEEWIKKLNENYSFPCRIAFNLIKESDGSVSLVSTLVKSKSKTENLKYSQVHAATWTSQGSAVLSVKEFNSALDYIKESERLRNIWGFALTSGNKK